jgi:hypothetical protein
MPDETLGYEWDSDADNGSRPAGEIDMSQTCENNVLEKLATVTEEMVSGTACNSLTLYRASSGALVFDAGTIQWAWGQVTFTNESASGWQEADFSSPIPVTAGTTYIASYFAPNGGYAYDAAAFGSAGVDNPPLHALSSSASGGNGVYLYSNSPGFPTDTYNATNYWVDVVFTEP